MIQEALTFDDVLLVPKHSEITSRKEVSIRNQLGPMSLSLPIISSPMDTVTEGQMAEVMAENGGLGIIHRYNTIEQQVSIIEKMKDCYVGAAIGVTGDYFERAQEIQKTGANVICIDIAHGDHILMKKAIQEIRNLDETIHIMAGNVATGDAFVRLAQWGADSIRVGIGGGSICSTRLNTGFGVPNLSAIFDCVSKWEEHRQQLLKHKTKHIRKPKLIIDGGIRNAGDIVKALAAGADFVMCGSLLAGTDEAPGMIMADENHQLIKQYRGMASKEAMEAGGKIAAPEGVSTTIPYKGSVVNILQNLAGNIRSGFSYAGARNISELQTNAHFIKQTHAGQQESFTHILSK